MTTSFGSIGVMPARRGPASPWQPPPEHPVEQERREALTARIRVKRIRPRLHCIMGLGGNILACESDEGVVLVDGGLHGERLANTIASLTPSPIGHLINTHWHFDHTDANAWLGKYGARIIAHQNTRRHLEQQTRVEDFAYTFAAVPSVGLPREEIRRERTLAVGDARLTLLPYQPAHTDGDIAVRFDAADLLHTGDTWWNGSYPFIDYSTGGSVEGLIAATERNLMMVMADTTIVPGHGAVGGRKELRQYYDLLTSACERIGRLKRLGHSVDEVIRRRPNAAHDDQWGTALVNPEFFIRLVYRGIP